MKRLNLDQYVLDVESLRSIKRGIRDVVSYDEAIKELNTLADFIEGGVFYSNLQSLIDLTDYLVEIINMINSDIYPELNELKLNFIAKIDNFLNELDSIVDI